MNGPDTDEGRSGAPSSPPAEAWRALLRRPDTVIAAGVVLFFAVMAAFPRLFTSTSPRTCPIRDARLDPQGWGGAHPLGTDALGCDVLATLVHGVRPSLLLAVVVVGVSLLIGVTLGLLAGYYLGWVDYLVSRAVEVFLVIPLLLAALLVLSLFQGVDLGSGTFEVILLPAVVLILFGWMPYARYVRASTLEAKNLDYVTAARSLGASDPRILVRHVLPNAIGTVTALLPTSVAGVISAEAVLSFLGIGVRPPATSWGIQIEQGSEWVTGGAPHILLAPLICLVATVLALVVLGDALRDALDPRLAR
ncbi:ABC transporter permease [Myceligenerans xiligouense]|uniref:Peptide/nickel transport system permease protein/oligopeptide transport system permease protein n=1 Tax=Myceligenerans xiligouense TaxID=253184 RepID=A0A3N4YKX8_9MICO|nr:ABC transporter permease [Myceligenerans xiligouense]RPF19974.1 peptide/nickel transport system permease protein/oligopeptide transport system permease protein [Myceligenerans xiligouense]